MHRWRQGLLVHSRCFLHDSMLHSRSRCCLGANELRAVVFGETANSNSLSGNVKGLDFKPMICRDRESRMSRRYLALERRP